MRWELTFTMMVDENAARDELLILGKAGQLITDRLTKNYVDPLEGISDITVTRFRREDIISSWTHDDDEDY
jgi:hypothetical protein